MGGIPGIPKSSNVNGNFHYQPTICGYPHSWKNPQYRETLSIKTKHYLRINQAKRNHLYRMGFHGSRHVDASCCNDPRKVQIVNTK